MLKIDERIQADPVRFAKMCWPDIRLFKEQREILYSIRDNDETVVPAGNALGKDFIASIACLWWMCRSRPCRCVTTSVKYDQIRDVLWGEIKQRLDTCAIRLPLQYNHLHIRQIRNDGSLVPLAELVGQVVNKGESMLGRHLPNDIPRTLAVFDEASGIDSSVYETACTWAHRILIISNTYPTTNFFFKAVKEGDLLRDPDDPSKGYYRKVIKIKAEHSPNIRLALAEIKSGKEPSGTILIPGVKDYRTYLKHRLLWDDVRQCIGLDAEFYEGASALLYPPEWRNRAETLAAKHPARRKGKAMGVDPAEGGDSTCWSIVDHLGLIHLLSMKTPDTDKITGQTLQLMNEYSVPAENVVFDAGGGGKQHADRLRAQGYRVRTVPFGAAVSPDKKRGMTTLDVRKEEDETRYIYKNKRAEMYGILRLLLDPIETPDGFGLPADYTELARQMAPLPLLFDGEGRMYLPPKSKPKPNSEEITLTEMLGCSPDELDSLVLATYGLMHKAPARRAGVAF